MTQETYVFKDENFLIQYLYRKLDNPTLLKVQKTLYFLWAFYAATYGNIDYNSENEFSKESSNEKEKYPRELYEAEFEAWKYGPVQNSVYADEKSSLFPNDKYDNLQQSMSLTNESMRREIIQFLDNIISQVNKVDDFGLVERSHKDRAWKIAYQEGVPHLSMCNKTIKEDYINYLDQATK